MAGEDPGHAASGKAAALVVEEKSLLRAQAGAQSLAVGQIVQERGGGRRAKRHHALFRALSKDPHPALLQIQVSQIEPDCPAYAQTRRVHELEERAVAAAQ